MSAATNLTEREYDLLKRLSHRADKQGCAWLFDVSPKLLIDLEERGLVKGVKGPVMEQWGYHTATVEITAAGEALL